MSRTLAASPSLRSRFHALMHRWTIHFGVAWSDLFGGRSEDSYSTRMHKKLKAWLDLDPLEVRQMPSFGLSLYTNAAPDPIQGSSTAVGRTSVGLLDGNASQSIPIYVSRQDTGGPVNFVYDSNTVNVKPIVIVQLTSGGADPVPTGIDATLTFNGTADSPVSFTTTGHSAGDTYLLGVQHATQITSSGYYAWSMSVTLHFSGQADQVVSASGSMPIVVRDTSSDSFGKGWSLEGLDKLAIDGSGALYIYGGSGEARYFTGTSGTLTNPANDFGTLVKNGNGSYTYTAYDQVKTNFDSNGRITTRVDPHGLTTSYTFDVGGKLTRIDSPDGSGTSFTYDGNGLLQTALQPGSLTATFAHASGSDLTSTQYPDGANRTFTYDGNHKLTKEQWGSQTATLAYSNGMLSSIDRGGSSSTSFTPELAPGLSTTPAKNVSAGVAVVTDPLSHVGTYTLDSLGRTTKYVAPDGGTQQWSLNSAGLPTKYTDQLSHVTSFTYGNSNADVTKIEYPDGGVVTMGYDSTFHTVTSRVDQLGNHTTMTYDATTGDLLTIKDALNGVTTLVWGSGPPFGKPKGLLLSVTDPLGHTLTYTYNTTNFPRQLQSMTDAAGNLTQYTYDSAGRRTGVQQPFTGGGEFVTSPITTYTFDQRSQITGTLDPLNHQQTFAYDAVGQLIDKTDQLGRRSTYAYDSRGNLTSYTEAIGTGDQRTVAFSYDAANQMTARADGLNHTSTLGYDSVGRMITSQDALGNVTTTTYDLAGNITAITDPLGHTSSFGFDSMNRQTTVTDALSHTTTTAFDLAGNVRSVTDADGTITSHAYDALNRQTREIDDYGGGLERTLTTTYDAVGNVTAFTDGNGHTTTSTYDAINRVSTIKDALGHTTTFAYSADLRQETQTTDALNNTTTRTYDLDYRLQTIQRPGGGTETFAYDAVGNMTADTNELGKTTTYTFDNLNRQTQITDPLNGKTTFAFDAADNRTLVVDPVGNRTTSVFDAVNRLTSETDPTNHTSSFAYDAAGRMTSTTDRLGRRRDFAYDETNNKLTEKWYASGGSMDQTQTWTYDALGQMLTAVDPDGANTFTYDALNRVSTVQEPFGLTLTNSYDAGDNRTLFQDSKGGTETFAYDAANNLTSVKFTNGGLATVGFDFSYDARNSITKLTRYGSLNGTATVGWTSFSYDSRGRLTNQQHRDSSNTSLNNSTFTYDNFDRLTTKVVNGTTTTYSYDDTNQLTGDGTRNYSYDANGNRNSTGYTTGAGNQTTNDGTWTYTYDNEGNLTKKSKGASLETWNYSYDQQNHLVTVEKHSTDGGTLQSKVQYKYDALDNRIERTEDSNGDGTIDKTERFGYDGADVWADLDGNNGLTYRRLFGPGVDDPVARVTAAGTLVWYLLDYQNSVIGLVDSTGASLGSVTYDGFGNILTNTTGANGDRYGFTSREWDSAVSLQFNRRRYYDPNLSKWTSTDPMGFDAGDANLYRYVGNRSTVAVDPSGLYIPNVSGGFEPLPQFESDYEFWSAASLLNKIIELRNEIESLKDQLHHQQIELFNYLGEWEKRAGGWATEIELLIPREISDLASALKQEESKNPPNEGEIERLKSQIRKLEGRDHILRQWIAGFVTKKTKLQNEVAATERSLAKDRALLEYLEMLYFYKTHPGLWVESAPPNIANVTVN